MSYGLPPSPPPRDGRDRRHASRNRRALLAGLLLVPLIELAVAIRVGMQIGAPATVLLLLLGSATGVVLIQHEGVRAWQALARQAAARPDGSWPVRTGRQGPGHAVLRLLAGLLLAFPGFVTDVIGLLLLIPGVRNLLLPVLTRLVTRAFGGAVVRWGVARSGGHPYVQGEVIDVEVQEVTRAPRADDEEPPGPG